jgi:hypothetical protein
VRGDGSGRFIRLAAGALPLRLHVSVRIVTQPAKA